MKIIQSKVKIHLSGEELELLCNNCKEIRQLDIFKSSSTSSHLKDIESFASDIVFYCQGNHRMTFILKEIELEFSLDFITKAMTQFFSLENSSELRAIFAVSNTVFPRIR